MVRFIILLEKFSYTTSSFSTGTVKSKSLHMFTKEAKCKLGHVERAKPVFKILPVS